VYLSYRDANGTDRYSVEKCPICLVNSRLQLYLFWLKYEVLEAFKVG
jgi:hypothetical protein